MELIDSNKDGNKDKKQKNSLQLASFNLTEIETRDKEIASQELFKNGSLGTAFLGTLVKRRI